MAALVAGVQYGLSSRNSSENPNEKPIVIFVKFTDSAFRALEEYLKNVDRTTQKPTIQFLQNKGHLSIPTQQAQSSRPQIFNFTLSPNADEGTFECLQSKGSRALESFGAPSHNMCIQAKDDVYETTRHRMAVAEEQQKKNCTKVIKPDLDDIGRKVKVTSWSSGASNHSAKGFSSGGLSDNARIVHNPPAQHHSRVVSNNHAQKPGNPELMRRPIRERLIHLLALRPYKKPELYDRISRDGLSEKDKKLFTQVLSQVARLAKDNTYHPVRSVWNDVQEDWPFYTEQDRQMLRRRKPQNLTPPGSSDTGSSGSGQSPTSTHPGSPPSVTQAQKRPGYHQSADGIESKRRRISHYHKLQNESSSSSSSVVGGGSGIGGLGVGSGNSRPTPDAVTIGDGYHHQDDVRSHAFGSMGVGGGGGGLGSDARSRRVDDERTYLVKNASDSKKSNSSDVNKRPNYALNDMKDVNDVSYANDVKKCASDGKPMYDQKFDEKSKRSDSPATVTSSQTQGDAALRPKWGVDYTDTRTSYEDADTIQENTVSASDTIPDYLTEYTTITNDSQRRRYKDDFYAHYEEYKNLHAIMESVTQKFSQLEANLREIKDRNSQQYQRIKKQIMMEYEKNKSDKEHQEAKKKFQYLHEKLSRIKKLVSEYDSSYY